MSRIFLLFGLSLSLLLGCNRSEGGIDFISIHQLELSGLTKKSSTLQAVLTFKNKFKSEDYKLKNLDADITIEGVDVGTFYTKQTLAVKANSEVNIPLSYAVDNARLFQDESESPSSILIKIKGNAVFNNVQGDEQQVSFNHQETISVVVSKRQQRKERRSEAKKERRESQLDKAKKKLQERAKAEKQ